MAEKQAFLIVRLAVCQWAVLLIGPSSAECHWAQSPVCGHLEVTREWLVLDGPYLVAVWLLAVTVVAEP